MPRQRYKIYGNTERHAYFVTCSTVQWIGLFLEDEACQILVDTWEYQRREGGLKIFAWVIMANHVHAVLSAPDLQKAIQSWKSWTAKKVIQRLEHNGNVYLLNELEHLRQYGHGDKLNHLNGRRSRQLWNEGYHPQILDSDSLWEQKADYIHHNPVKKGLVSRPEHWRFSSAHEWCPGSQPVMRTDPWYPQNPVKYD